MIGCGRPWEHVIERKRRLCSKGRSIEIYTYRLCSTRLPSHHGSCDFFSLKLCDYPGLGRVRLVLNSCGRSSQLRCNSLEPSRHLQTYQLLPAPLLLPVPPTINPKLCLPFSYAEFAIGVYCACKAIVAVRSTLQDCGLTVGRARSLQLVSATVAAFRQRKLQTQQLRSVLLAFSSPFGNLPKRHRGFQPTNCDRPRFPTTGSQDFLQGCLAKQPVDWQKYKYHCLRRPKI